MPATVGSWYGVVAVLAEQRAARLALGFEAGGADVVRRYDQNATQGAAAQSPARED
jgi:hypothetical protein